MPNLDVIDSNLYPLIDEKSRVHFLFYVSILSKNIYKTVILFQKIPLLFAGVYDHSTVTADKIGTGKVLHRR